MKNYVYVKGEDDSTTQINRPNAKFLIKFLFMVESIFKTLVIDTAN